MPSVQSPLTRQTVEVARWIWLTRSCRVIKKFSRRLNFESVNFHCAVHSTNKGLALYVTRDFLQLVSRFTVVQFANMIILTSEINAKKKSACATVVKTAITRT